MDTYLGAVKVNIQVKRAWWFMPFVTILYAVAITRLIRLQRLANWMTSAAHKAYKYRVNRGEWRTLIDPDFRIDLERRDVSER